MIRFRENLTKLLSVYVFNINSTRGRVKFTFRSLDTKPKNCQEIFLLDFNAQRENYDGLFLDPIHQQRWKKYDWLGLLSITQL